MWLRTPINALANISVWGDDPWLFVSQVMLRAFSEQYPNLRLDVVVLERLSNM